MAGLQRLLLIGLLTIAVRFVYLYEIQDSPLLTYPGGVSALFVGETSDREAGLDHPLPRAPVYTRILAAALPAAGGDLFPVYVCQAMASAATCVLVCILTTTLFSPAVAVPVGVAAAFYGPSIYPIAELTPTTWSTLLQLLFLISVARPPIRKSAYRWAFSGVLLGLALVESFPARNLELRSLAEYAVNLLHLVQGRELLPDLDPYLVGGNSVAIKAVLWDEWLAFPTGVILPLAVPGLALFAKNEGGRTTAGRTLLVFVVASAAVFGTLAPDGRQRLPLALLMLPFAVHALERFWRGDRRMGIGATVLFLLVACNLGVAAPAHLAGATHHHYWSGVAYAHEGMTANAIGAYRRAVEKMPTHRPATQELAKLYLEGDQPDEALAVCSAFLRVQPATPEILLLQGDGFAAVGRMDDAVSAYQQIRARGAPPPGLLARLGEAYHATGRMDRAIDAYDEAVAARPDSTALRYRLAQLYSRTGQTGRAIAQYEALLSQEPENHLWHARLGGALLEQSLDDSLFDVDAGSPVEVAELQQAETHLREAIRLRPDYLGARQLLVSLLSGQQRYPEAIAHLEYVREKVPDDPHPHLLLGILKERVGKEIEAQRHREIYTRLDRGKQFESVAKAEFARVLDRMMPNLQSHR